MSNNKLEIACFNYQSAIIAEQGGADRIELCDNFSLGGTTPSYETFRKARQKIAIDLFVMIRPRGGDFNYNTEAFEQMKKDISFFTEAGADGFVFGILQSDHNIHIQQCVELVSLASSLPCSLHRAFDKTTNTKQSLESAIASGFKTVLTSGFTSSAMDGLENLKSLVSQANNRICIMPGGGVRSSNLEEIKFKTQANYFHSSAIIQGDIADINEVIALKKILS